MALHTGFCSCTWMVFLMSLLRTTTSRTFLLLLIIPHQTHSFFYSYIGADLTYLNFVVGVVIMFIFFVPIQTWLYRRDRIKRGQGRPEARFLLSTVMVWGFPISLFWFAFTSNGKTSFWSPVVAGGLLGVSDPLLWLSMLNYLTDSYPNVAGAAVAAFLIPSFALAAGFVHIGMSGNSRLSGS